MSASEGSVTAKLRQLWGYDNILRDLNLDRYRSMGETEVVTVEHRDGQRTDERIKDWSKRRIIATTLSMPSSSLVLGRATYSDSIG